MRIGRDGDRAEVVKRYSEYLNASGLKKFVGELRGCTLVCFCDIKERCHGDILIELADGIAVKERLLNNEDYRAIGSTDDYVEETAKRADHLDLPSEEARRRARGPPRRSEFLGTVKAFADGGGLCSPGRWAPEARGSEKYRLCGLREALWPPYQEAVVD